MFELYARRKEGCTRSDAPSDCVQSAMFPPRSIPDLRAYSLLTGGPYRLK
jgi:hypothetical protein